MNIKNDKGLTLVVLVITLIVMMMLSSIFIAGAINDGTIKSVENVVKLQNELINKTKENEENMLIKNVVLYDVNK